MTLSNMTFLFLFAFIVQIQAQFFFQQPFGGFFNQQPQQAFQPQNLFQPFQLQTLPPPVTTLEPIPDPDKEVGNFPIPNPRNWPVGPDWNDPRNTLEQQLGWGGNGLVKSTFAPEIATKTNPIPVKKTILKIAPRKAKASTPAKLKLKRVPAVRRKLQ